MGIIIIIFFNKVNIIKKNKKNVQPITFSSSQRTNKILKEPVRSKIWSVAHAERMLGGELT